MQFPFETTTKDGRKATVLGAMPDGRLIGYAEYGVGFSAYSWEADGSNFAASSSITLPLQIKPLTTYRMRNGRLAWTSGLVRDGLVYGTDARGNYWSWLVSNGRWAYQDEPYDLIEELPPGTTE